MLTNEEARTKHGSTSGNAQDTNKSLCAGCCSRIRFYDHYTKLMQYGANLNKNGDDLKQIGGARARLHLHVIFFHTSRGIEALNQSSLFLCSNFKFVEVRVVLLVCFLVFEPNICVISLRSSPVLFRCVFVCT
jgi:hypothetical protein